MSLHEPLWNSNFRYYFGISVAALKIPPGESVTPDDLNQAYEIMNRSSVSHIVWTDDGIFIFTLTVIDPDFR